MGFFARFFAVFIIGFGFVLSLPATALAADGNDTFWGNVFAGVFTLVAGAVATLLGRLAVKAAKKVGLDIDEVQEAAIKRTVMSVILFVEERAKLKARLNEKMPSDEKLSLAVAGVMERVPGISKQEAIFRVQSSLKEVGLGASGFLAGAAKDATDFDDTAGP